MKAVQIHKHGGPEVLKIKDIPIPEPGHGQIQIHLKLAALNHLDIWVRNGIPGVRLPIIPGCDGAGTVSKIGDGVKNFSRGDDVLINPLIYCNKCSYCKSDKENFCDHFGIFGETTNGTCCEYIVLEEHQVYPKPENISFQQAAAFPLVAQTAYQMLVKRAHIRKGETVLVWGAGSGVGHMAVQIAKYYGCTVVATAGSAEKCQFAQELGADFVINHQTENVLSKVKEFCGNVEVVFEHVGEATWDISMKLLKKGGRVVTCGATTGANAKINLRHLFYKQQSVLGSTMGDADTFRQVLKLVANGTLQPRIDKSFALENIAQAYEYLEKSEQFGKVIIEI